MITKLIGKLKLVKDFRSDSGKRHELWVVLLVVIFQNFVVFVSLFSQESGLVLQIKSVV
jgi:hypothetical protein